METTMMTTMTMMAMTTRRTPLVRVLPEAVLRRLNTYIILCRHIRMTMMTMTMMAMMTRRTPLVRVLPEAVLRRLGFIHAHAAGALHLPHLPAGRAGQVCVLPRLPGAGGALPQGAPLLRAPGVPGEEVHRVPDGHGVQATHRQGARRHHDQAAGARVQPNDVRLTKRQRAVTEQQVRKASQSE
eukprot:1066542-Prorocentrum_minimum.AAC.2